MEKEISRRIAEQEKSENLNGSKVIVYRYSDDQEGMFRASVIKESSDDKLSVFIKSEIRAVLEDIKNTRKDVREYSDKKRHGQSISSAQVRRVRESKEGDVNKMYRKLRILEGKEIFPVVLEKKEEEITGSNLNLSARESRWWSYLKKNPEILELPQDDMQFLLEAYFVRYDIKAGTQEAKERYYKLLEQLRGDKEHLTNFVVDITKHFTS